MKSNEFKNQLNAIKAAITNLEYGVEKGERQFIETGVRQLKAKSEQVIAQAKLVIK